MNTTPETKNSPATLVIIAMTACMVLMAGWLLMRSNVRPSPQQAVEGLLDRLVHQSTDTSKAAQNALPPIYFAAYKIIEFKPLPEPGVDPATPNAYMANVEFTLRDRFKDRQTISKGQYLVTWDEAARRWNLQEAHKPEMLPTTQETK